jgi:hypothetical protein
VTPVYKLSANSVKNGRTVYGSMLAGNTAFSLASFESIATVSVGSGGSSTITFSSIPNTYAHLQIRGLARSSNIYYNAGVLLRVNGDSGSNYSRHRLEGEGTAAYADGSASVTSTQQLPSTGGASLANNFAGFVIDILDYANTNKYKTIRTLTGYENNGNGSGNDRGDIQLNSGSWQNTAAITSISFTINDASNFVQYTTFALYGIKGA